MAAGGKAGRKRLLKPLLAILAFVGSSAVAVAQETPCPHEKGWTPTAEQLAEFKTAEPLGGRRANFCNANLRFAKLNNADLRFAKLNNASLYGAQLNNASLYGAELNNAFLRSAELNNADLRSAKLNKAELRFAKLNNAKLSSAELNNANLRFAKLNKAELRFAELNNASLERAELNNASLERAELNNASLERAELNNAILGSAQLNNADLRGAQLNNADLSRTQLKDAQLAGIQLKNATYAPASAPPAVYVAGIEGLETVSFPFGEEVGLVQLRDLLQKAGLREDERKATYAIERGRTQHLFDSWHSTLGEGTAVERGKAFFDIVSLKELPKAIDALFRIVAFDWTTSYGLTPARAFEILFGIWLLLTFVYLWPLSLPPTPADKPGIFQIWPPARIDFPTSQAFWPPGGGNFTTGPPTIQRDPRVERLHRRGPGALLWAAWFSLLSAFHIGFREFSVGTWLSRVHPRQFALEATGWVRTVSGLQSLLSVYLLAMWVLTYFGRPFQ